MNSVQNGNLFGQKEILDNIFSRLQSLAALYNVSRVCKLWHELIAKEPDPEHKKNAENYLKECIESASKLKSLQTRHLTWSESKLISGEIFNIQPLETILKANSIVNGTIFIKNEP